MIDVKDTYEQRDHASAGRNIPSPFDGSLLSLPLIISLRSRFVFILKEHNISLYSRICTFPLCHDQMYFCIYFNGDKSDGNLDSVTSYF